MKKKFALKQIIYDEKIKLCQKIMMITFCDEKNNKTEKKKKKKKYIYIEPVNVYKNA